MTTNPPNSDFPIGAAVIVVDAWGRNPIAGKITRHYGVDCVLVEDEWGVVYFAQTWRLTATDLSLEEMLA